MANHTRPANGTPTAYWPLICRWSGNDRPLPRRTIRMPGRRAYALNGNGAGFDFCAHVRRLCRDISRRCEELSQLDVRRMLFSVTQARNSHVHGLQARVTPLRFHDGRLTRRRRGVNYQVQRYVVDARDVLYIVTFCLPRFLDLAFEEKLVTFFHELYHISPRFDGDLRRHDGRYAIHSHSQRLYDERMAKLVKAYLASKPDSAVLAFLRSDFAEIQRRHGGIVGVVVPRPKIIPLREPLNGRH